MSHINPIHCGWVAESLVSQAWGSCIHQELPTTLAYLPRVKSNLSFCALNQSTCAPYYKHSAGIINSSCRDDLSGHIKRVNRTGATCRTPTPALHLCYSERAVSVYLAIHISPVDCAATAFRILVYQEGFGLGRAPSARILLLISAITAYPYQPIDALSGHTFCVHYDKVPCYCLNPFLFPYGPTPSCLVFSLFIYMHLYNIPAAAGTPWGLQPVTGFNQRLECWPCSNVGPRTALLLSIPPIIIFRVHPSTEDLLGSHPVLTSGSLPRSRV